MKRAPMYEELSKAVAQLQLRATRDRELGLLGEAGGFLFYGEQQPGQRPQLAGYRVAREPFPKDAQAAREAVLRLIPLPILEAADYLEVLPPPSISELYWSPVVMTSLVVKDRHGTAPRFLEERLWTKRHADLRADRGTLNPIRTRRLS